MSLISSQLLLFEALNGLRSAVLQKRLEQKRALILAKAFLDLEIEVEEENFEAVFNLALKRKITVYDAGYLWLAEKRKVKWYNIRVGDELLRRNKHFENQQADFDQ